MEHYWWCTEGDDCECDPDVTEEEAVAREHDRLMNERARLILDGVDRDELAMPIYPLRLDHPWHP